MPKSPLKKSLQEYISNIKKTPSSHFRIPSKSIPVSAKRFIRGCKHPRTHSFALDNIKNQNQNIDKNDESATLADVDRFLFENFKSLYINDEYDDEESNHKAPNEPSKVINSPPPLDLCGTSATSSDDVAPSPTSTSITGRNSKQTAGPEDFIALLTYSPNPHNDFKQSMQEIIEARFQHQGKIDWEFMEELLSCFMDLNNKNSYKHILSAFVDLVVTLRENSGKVPARSQWPTTNRRN